MSGSNGITQQHATYSMCHLETESAWYGKPALQKLKSERPRASNSNIHSYYTVKTHHRYLLECQGNTKSL